MNSPINNNEKNKKDLINNKFQDLVENMQDAYFQSDLLDRISFLNSTALSMFGYSSKEEILGRPTLILYANKTEREKIIYNLKNNKNTSDLTVRGIKKDGTDLWVSINAQLLYDQQGNISGTIGVVRDISKRIEIEKANNELLNRLLLNEENLKKSNRLYAIISQVNQAIVHIKDKPTLFQKICDISINYGKLSMAWIGLIDEKSNQILPSASAGLEEGYLTDIPPISADDIPEGRGVVGKAIRKGGYSISYDCQLDPAMAPWKGQIIKRGYKSSISLPIKESGKVIGAFTLYAPVTNFFDTSEIKLLIEVADDINFALDTLELEKKHKQYEQDIIYAKEKAEENNMLKTSFLANMSHEIRTPLNSIIGFSELLLDSSFTHEQQIEFANFIKQNGDNLLAIINDILDVSKIEAGQVNIHKKLFWAGEIIHKVAMNQSQTLKNDNLVIKTNLPQNDLQIYNDDVRFEQIIVNFVSNAIKFTECGFIEIGYSLANNSIQVYVKDTGIGIPSELHKKIFDRFRQVETSLMRKYGGNGLGLAIASELAKLMGGTLSMESEVGKGSTFYFCLPL